MEVYGWAGLHSSLSLILRIETVLHREVSHRQVQLATFLPHSSDFQQQTQKKSRKKYQVNRYAGLY